MQIEEERKKNTSEKDNIFPKNSLGHPNFSLTKKTVFHWSHSASLFFSSLFTSAWPTKKHPVCSESRKIYFCSLITKQGLRHKQINIIYTEWGKHSFQRLAFPLGTQATWAIGPQIGIFSFPFKEMPPPCQTSNTASQVEGDVSSRPRGWGMAENSDSKALVLSH